MNYRISPQDLERVSAYLDQALSVSDLEAFERRLGTDPNLARAVAELDSTRALLRRAPQRRLTRSFTVKAHMVSSPRQQGYSRWNSFSLVSAAATLMLVLVFAGDIWASGLLQFGAAAPLAEEVPQALMAEQSTAEDSIVTATPSISAPADAGEIERFAVPEGADLQAKAPIDLQTWFVEYVRPVEFSLVVIAVLAGIVAWWRSRKD